MYSKPLITKQGSNQDLEPCGSREIMMRVLGQFSEV